MRWSRKLMVSSKFRRRQQRLASLETAILYSMMMTGVRSLPQSSPHWQHHRLMLDCDGGRTIGNRQLLARALPADRDQQAFAPAGRPEP